MGAVGTEFLRNVSATERFLIGISNNLERNFLKSFIDCFQPNCMQNLHFASPIPALHLLLLTCTSDFHTKRQKISFSFTWTRTANIQFAHIHLMVASLLIFQSFLEMGRGSFFVYNRGNHHAVSKILPEQHLKWHHISAVCNGTKWVSYPPKTVKLSQSFALLIMCITGNNHAHFSLNWTTICYGQGNIHFSLLAQTICDLEIPSRPSEVAWKPRLSMKFDIV